MILCITINVIGILCVMIFEDIFYDIILEFGADICSYQILSFIQVYLFTSRESLIQIFNILNVETSTGRVDNYL